MKLQKVKAREYKGKTIFKYMIVIPPRDIQELGWVHGVELIGNVVNNNYFISKK